MQGVKRKDIDELFNEFYTYVFRIAIGYTKNESDAEDICSEVFITVYKALDRFIPMRRYSYQAWIKKITINKTINFIKSKHVIKGKKTVSLEDIDNIKDIIPVTDKDGSHKEIREMINEIDDPLIRIAAEKIYYEGKTMDKIAEELNIPSGTLRRRLYEFRKRYQKKRDYE